MEPDLKVVPVGICHLCRYLDTSPEGGARRCKAFPTGIPDEVRFGLHDHHKPFPGDHGIQFEPLDGVSAS